MPYRHTLYKQIEVTLRGSKSNQRSEIFLSRQKQDVGVRHRLVLFLVPTALRSS
jgi:hypothetical protein